MAFNLQPLNIIILAHRSLLSGGIASRLSEYAGSFVVHLVDSESDDVAAVLSERSPAVIILDASDSEICQRYPVARLLEWAPQAKVIRLSLTNDRIQVFSSMELQISRTSELVNFIQAFFMADQTNDAI